VGEFRQIGMIAALELVENKAQKKEFDGKNVWDTIFISWP